MIKSQGQKSSLPKSNPALTRVERAVKDTKGYANWLASYRPRQVVGYAFSTDKDPVAQYLSAVVGKKVEIHAVEDHAAPKRFKFLGGSAERYQDLTTGENISRREYMKRSALHRQVAPPTVYTAVVDGGISVPLPKWSQRYLQRLDAAYSDASSPDKILAQDASRILAELVRN